MIHPVEKLKQLSNSNRLYLAGGVFLLLSIFTNPAMLNWEWLHSSALTLSGPCFGLGFLAWTLLEHKGFWSHKGMRYIFYAGNVVAWGICHVAAKNVVSEILGLPSQDFESAVLGVAIITYIPAVILLLVFMLVLFGVFTAVGFSVMWSAKEGGRHLHLLGHVAGAFFISSACLFGLHFMALGTDRILPQYVRGVAYLCDFQPAYKYPGIMRNERVRLHANGVISVATILENRIEVHITSWEERAKLNLTSTPIVPQGNPNR